MTTLTGLVICQDEERRLGACLESLTPVVDELVVVDGGSRDRTQAIAVEHGARLVEHPFQSMNDQKERGRRACRTEWVLLLDADERLDARLAAAIPPALLAPPRVAAFSIAFRNHFGGRWVRRAGWYPDRHVRLFRRDRAFFDVRAPVHDRLVVDGAVRTLPGEIHHLTWDSFDHGLAKTTRYAKRFAAHAAHHRDPPTSPEILARASWRFVRSYVLELGFLEGHAGLAVSALAGFETLQKYLRLWEVHLLDSENRGLRGPEERRPRGPEDLRHGPSVEP